MLCMQCKYEFCWLCLAAWKEHGEATGGFYACNRCAKGPTMLTFLFACMLHGSGCLSAI